MGKQSGYDLVLTGGAIVTMDSDRKLVENGFLAVKEDRIAALGPADTEEAAQAASLAKRVIRTEGKVLVPGLINAHSHLAMTLFRGFAEDLVLQRWLEKIWKYELTMLDEAAIRAGSSLAFAELLRCGVTCAHDMYWHYMETINLAEEIGFRLVSGPSFTTIGDFDFDQMLLTGRCVLEDLEGYDFILPVMQAHSTYTTSAAMMGEVLKLKQEYGVPFTTHASENRQEVDDVLARFGKTPIQLLDEYGLLDDRTILAHCVELQDEEIQLLADTGTHVAHCPESNLKLGSGIARIADMLEAGVSVCLGTDGPASNNDLDLLGELRTAALLQKGFTRNPEVFTTTQAMEMVTVNGARAYGAESFLGSLEVGKKADVVVINLEQTHMTPLHDICANLIYSVNKYDVETVLINGDIKLEDGVVTCLDEEEAKAEVRAVAGRFV
ncbi:MAG: amidohydrolase [Anaerolineales bacterium]|nr:amidohydrolase [Anaerolineales bacterium]